MGKVFGEDPRCWRQKHRFFLRGTPARENEFEKEGFRGSDIALSKDFRPKAPMQIELGTPINGFEIPSETCNGLIVRTNN